MPRTFVSVHRLVSEISQGLQQKMLRNFVEISSGTKVRNLFVEIREIRSHFFGTVLYLIDSLTLRRFRVRGWL